MKGFATMLAFFTRIPVRLADDWDASLYQKGIRTFFLIGVILGVPVGAVTLLRPWAGPFVCAFGALVVYLLLCGGLHVDGMADTMDAFAANRDREGTLAIMKDSHTGAFGVLAICVYTVGMTVLLAQTHPLAVWLFPLTGRTAALLNARLFACARPGGLGQRFIDGVKTSYVATAAGVFLAAAAAAFLLIPGMGGWPLFGGIAAAFAAAQLVIALVVKGMAKRLGGITGDVIGFAVETSQLVFLLGGCILSIIIL